MSKQYNIQKKLWKAYGKVANTLGEQFEVYRCPVTSNPLIDRYLIDTKNIAFSKDEKFKQPPSSGVSIWNCWIDGNLDSLFDIQQGDYLVSRQTGETYVIISAEPLLTIRALRTPDTIIITRSTYGDSGSGFQPGDSQIAHSVPCWIEQASASGGTNQYIPAASYDTDALSNVLIHLSDPENLIEPRDAIIDQNSNRYQVLSVNRSDIGTKIIAKEYTP